MGFRFRRFVSINMIPAKILEIFGLQCDFFTNSQNSMGDFGKMVGVMEEMRPKVTPRVQKLEVILVKFSN